MEGGGSTEPGGSTGGDDTTNNEDSIDSGTLWGWLSGLADKLTSVVENIKALPGLIIDGILNGLREIFIPDTVELENTLDAMVDNIGSQLGVQFNTLDRLYEREAAPEDVNIDYNLPGVGVLNLKILDTDFLIDGVAMMRPYIRGFMVLLLVLFNWSQVLSFIDQNPNIAHTAQQNYQEWKKGDNK